ncbi:MAG: sensor histidine kinase [Acidobacteria bacterium]|nr:sensor histidine kinase [Acidobacteriota bacterium]
MKRGTAAILLMGFGALVIMIAALGFGAFHRADQIESEIAAIHENYRQTALALSQTKEDAYKSGIIVRDYLLDPSTVGAPQYKQELLSIRSAMPQRLESLSRLISSDEGHVLERLRSELNAYWDSLDPVFEWTPQQRSAYSSAFLRREVISRRSSVFSIMREIDDLSARTFNIEQATTNKRRMEFQAYLWKMSAAAVFFALGIAAVSIFRVSALERRTENQRHRAENAETGLRHLSHQLVQAQEEERKRISRELHDEIGQMLTGLKMELANLEELRNSPGDEFQKHLNETRTITEQTMQSVRRLAMGLRPSMLDDLGLEPALRWQANEFSRRSGVPVSLETDGELENLSDSVRTCIYRVVQESLTNCARHAEASNVRITVHGSRDRIYLTIQDDGKGFDIRNPGSRGMGLIGMEERIKKLGGTLIISSQNMSYPKGTVLEIKLPPAGESLS